MTDNKQQKGRLGEPWEHTGPGVFTSHKYRECVTLSMGSESQDRIVACVNALDGLDPEGVAVAVEALRRAVSLLTDQEAAIYPTTTLASDLRKVLSALTGESA